MRCGGFVAKSGIGLLRKLLRERGWRLAMENPKAREGTLL
jgi:hypothetical protein